MDDTASGNDQTPGSASTPSIFVGAPMSLFEFGAMIGRAQAIALREQRDPTALDFLVSTPEATDAVFEDAARALEPVPFYGRGFPLQ